MTEGGKRKIVRDLIECSQGTVLTRRRGDSCNLWWPIYTARLQRAEATVCREAAFHEAPFTMLDIRELIDNVEEG